MPAFRALRSLTASTSRAVSARSFARSVYVPRLGSQLTPRAAVPASRWFSASARVMGDGSSRSLHPFVIRFSHFVDTADLALSQRLTEELKYEQEAKAGTEEPESLTAFKKHGIWEVNEHPLSYSPAY